ncbi:hypothetical protein Syun_010640 [Stephania yunnanensis]|uniref:25S rRNA (uridine-N(3))-methyltransferase BMT5-like domain-containing protein n=1 Tax=Stephania yunnanensis TaxID=152371 RepID=A0AAP0KGV7_9MAGN
MSNIQSLRSRGCIVIHNVDATKMAGNRSLNNVTYDRIVYNFPHAGFSKNEPVKDHLRRNRDLVSDFMANAAKMIDETGEIHISHKCNGFFQQWGLQKLGEKKGLVLIKEVEFKLSDYPGYNTKYGYGGDENFDCNPSRTYKFRLKDRRPIEEIKKEIWIKHYCSSHKILLVGEGDFSFSACLGRAFGRANNMVATSLNSQDFLKKNYGRAMSNIQSLKSRGCKVVHKVNATEMAGNKKLNVVKYDRIVYNFPHAGFSDKEFVTDEFRKHKNLVSLFMANAKKMIEEKGEIHISHKCNQFLEQQGLRKLAKKNGLVVMEEVKFNLSDYTGYNTKYGFGGDKNFDCNPSKTYKFRLKKRASES